jgi:hypothetical protein
MAGQGWDEVAVEKAAYLGGRDFAYSVTYDEALEDLFRETIPIHQEFGVPGHLSVVVGQMGQPRNLPGSSFHGMRHMSASQLRDMLSLGWTVGSHSWSHGIMAQDPYQEVVRSREVLEQALGAPVTAFIVPGDNNNHPAVAPVAREHGYLSVYTVTDGINTHDSDLYALNRSFMNEEGFPPIFHQYDPYRWLHWARERGGWIVEYTHRATREFLSPMKEISVESLRRRFERVRAVGGEGVWLAPPEAVADYLLMYRHTEVTAREAAPGQLALTLAVRGLPERVQRRELTLAVAVPDAGVRAQCEGKELALVPAGPGRVRLTVPVRDGLAITLTRTEAG